MTTAESTFWYRVELLNGTEPYCYFGRSSQNESDVQNTIESGAYLKLEDIIYFDEDHTPRSWTDWDSNFIPRILINPRYIISIMPMAGDPRRSDNDDHKILSLHRPESPNS